ncbi:exonuclease SbcCD subunit D [Rathayibacter oskolensis]|uniref:exonuclease SbcCD subunit D n=1 Tax=Rathayibacter oskolensis TaxID=1891671 RepID=UPI0034677316
MKLLHTSDWHIGRTFHGHSSVAALSSVLDALVETVRAEAVDAVLLAGDVFDSAVPAAEHYTLLTRTLEAIRGAGAEVVLTSGNHDSPARLGFQAGLLRTSGVHVLTDPERYTEPVVLRGADGFELGVYGIPYLEPALYRHRHPEESLRRHEEVLAFAMRRVRAHAEAAGRRWVVLSHCFAVGAPAGTVERDITAGGIDYVSVDHFAAADYAALGHIHGRATLLPNVRYSGAPCTTRSARRRSPRRLAGRARLLRPRRGRVVAAAGAPAPQRDRGPARPAAERSLLAEFEADWVSAVLTDEVRPLDAMARLQSRFPGCATLEHRPPHVPGERREYAERVRGRSDVEVVDDFLAHVRGGHGATEVERALVLDALAAVDAEAMR